MSVNKAIIVGNLGQDPESIDGGKGCRFSIATNERWTDKSGAKQERTEWHSIVVWGRTAETCMQYLSKGRQVYVEGQIQTDTYTDNDGVERRATKIKARRVNFLSGGNAGGGGRQGGQSSGGGGNFDQAFEDDDIPF